MKYAVIQTGGKQYRVSEGDTIEVERLATKPSQAVIFDQVLLYVTDGDVQVGKPVISGMQVMGELVDHARGVKIRVAKFKSKVRYRRVTGHRQAISKVKITQIGASKEIKREAKAVETKEKPAVQKVVAKKRAVVKAK